MKLVAAFRFPETMPTLTRKANHKMQSKDPLGYRRRDVCPRIVAPLPQYMHKISCSVRFRRNPTIQEYSGLQKSVATQIKAACTTSNSGSLEEAISALLRVRIDAGWPRQSRRERTCSTIPTLLSYPYRTIVSSSQVQPRQG